jgi:hypothetical protein
LAIAPVAGFDQRGDGVRYPFAQILGVRGAPEHHRAGDGQRLDPGRQGQDAVQGKPGGCVVRARSRKPLRVLAVEARPPRGGLRRDPLPLQRFPHQQPNQIRVVPMEVECRGGVAGGIGQPHGRLELRRLGQRGREHRLEQLLLVAEVAVDPLLVHPRGLGDAVYPSAVKAVLGKLGPGRGEQSPTGFLCVTCHPAIVARSTK